MAGHPAACSPGQTGAWTGFWKAGTPRPAVPPRWSRARRPFQRRPHDGKARTRAMRPLQRRPHDGQALCCSESGTECRCTAGPKSMTVTCAAAPAPQRSRLFSSLMSPWAMPAAHRRQNARQLTAHASYEERALSRAPNARGMRPRRSTRGQPPPGAGSRGRCRQSLPRALETLAPAAQRKLASAAR